MKNHIRVLRAQFGWSQGELASRVGVSRQAINAVETGKHVPSLTLAFSIAHAFGRLVEDVFEPDDDAAGADDP